MWFTRMLLYWDEVGAIIPYDYIKDPRRLSEHTRGLVEACLVRQVMPSAYVERIPSFRKSFINYLESLGTDVLDKRREALKMGACSRIHIEKMNGLEYELEEMEIAKAKYYPWYDVETETAREFMAYLAATLGRLEDLNFIPITDDLTHLEHFVYASSSTLSSEQKLFPLRLQILEDLFPAPSRPLKASEISRFKERHSDKLKKFRRAVEKELIDIVNISDPELRRRRLALFKEESREAVEELKSELSKFGFKHLTLSKIGSIISAIPGIPQLFGLANAVYNAFEDTEIKKQDVSLLYAAYAQKEILR